MLEVVSLLVVLVMSLIITRVATVALALTGMSQEAARFQARSALTGSGFTTTESERVVSHPLRRRIIMALMLLGNTGLVLGASLMVLFLGGERGGLPDRWQQVGLLLSGLLAFYLVARSAWLERAMAGFIERVLARHTDVAVRDHASLLRLGGDHRVVEMTVQLGDWMAGRSISELALAREGVLVLGITRADGSYLGAPRGAAKLEADDVAILYGKESVLRDLDERRAGVGGHLRHAESVARRQDGKEPRSCDDAEQAVDPQEQSPAR